MSETPSGPIEGLMRQLRVGRLPVLAIMVMFVVGCSNMATGQSTLIPFVAPSTARPAATDSPTTEPTEEPAPTEGSPAATPRPTPVVRTFSKGVSVGTTKRRFSGGGGTTTWSSVRFAQTQADLSWSITSGRARGCVLRWTIDPGSGSTLSGAIKVEGKSTESDTKRLTVRKATGPLAVKTDCAKWTLTLAGYVAPKPKPTAPPRSSDCHPSYEGACLKQGIGDYDCAGGSGNGPNYIEGPVYVVGYDEFGLDRDNDGIGCE